MLWLFKELSSIQIIYFIRHKSFIIKFLKTTENVFLLNQESTRKQNKTTAPHFHQAAVRQVDGGHTHSGSPQGLDTGLPRMPLSWIYNMVLARNFHGFVSARPSCLLHAILIGIFSSPYWGKCVTRTKMRNRIFVDHVFSLSSFPSPLGTGSRQHDTE